MRSLVLVPLVLLAAAEPAAASTCAINAFVVPEYDPPADCAIAFYRQSASSFDPPPRAHVYRNNQQVDVTGASTLVEMKELDVAIYTVDCDGNVILETHHPEMYEVFTITLANVQTGEQLYIDSRSAGSVQAAGGACNNSELPMPACSGMYDWSSCGEDPPPGDEVMPEPETNDAVGCSATRGSSIGWWVVALLGVLARRRRR